EHLRLPTVDDVKEGTIASKIAAHAADLTRGKDWNMDNGMAAARGKLDWEGMFAHALDVKKARRYREGRAPGNDDVCSMCGELCAIRMVKEHIGGEKEEKKE
ncbi:MAG: phosphomethylpyrimidine synthase ThiC, partial [Thermoplasmata archaeon]|nr:phosphomethylpyrimidine synthase ThiC [Thermoplasmata archaeon]